MAENKLKQVDQKFYDNFRSELNVSTDLYTSFKGETQKEDAVMEQQRQCLIHLAKAKTGLSTVTLNICWQVKGKYYTETITA